MTGPMPGGMPAMPGVQFGNTPLDISSAVNSFAKGLQEARAQRRKEQMDQAMLGIQFMNAQGRMNEMGNMNMQRHLDDLRSKGIYVNPGQMMGDVDWAQLTQLSQKRSQEIRDWELLSPQAQQGEQSLYQQTGGQRGRMVPSRELEIPNVGGQGSIKASIFMDPAHLREWQAVKQDERGRWANQIREAYLDLAKQKFAFQRADPTTDERSVAGSVANMVSANKDLRSIEMNWPQSADWSGAIKILTSTRLADVLPQLLAMAPQGSAEQRYYIAMHRWLSEFFPAKAGKVLTENEIRTYFPMLFATGFTAPETFDEIYKARNGAIRQTMFHAGPGLLQALRAGTINAGDIPPEILQEFSSFYGGGPGANTPGNAPPSPNQSPVIQPKVNSIRARQDAKKQGTP